MLLAALLGCGMRDACAAAAGVPYALDAPARRAKLAFHAQVEPAPTQMTVFQIGEREDGETLRWYLLRSYDAAIDALVQEAVAHPDREPEVRHLLWRVVLGGTSARTDDFFERIAEREAARGPAGAGAAAAAPRHAVALRGLLPALLGHVRNFEHGGLAQDGRPLASHVLPAYRRAAAAEPDAPWTWVVIAWLSADPQARRDAATRASAAAERAGDARARMAADAIVGELERAAGKWH